MRVRRPAERSGAAPRGARWLTLLLCASVVTAGCLRGEMANPAATATAGSAGTRAPATATTRPALPATSRAGATATPTTATQPTATTTTAAETATASAETPAPPPGQEVDLPDVELAYAIDAELTDFDAGLVEASSTVQVTSREAEPLERLFFRVAPARDGYFRLRGLLRDGQPLAALPSDGGTTLEVALAPGLAPGATTVLRFDFTLAVGESADGFASIGRDGPVLRLGYWYPMLSNDEGYPPILDPPYTLTADFTVTFRAPEDVVVAAAGPAQAGNASGEALTWTLEQGRDFALMLSRDYVAEQRQLADGTLLQLYTIPELYGVDEEEREARRQLVVDTAQRALTEYEARLGEYPWRTLTIAEGGPDLGGGIEYTALTIVTFDASWLEVLVAHEIAHMWFYAAIGTRTQADPWIDEGAATFLSEGMLGGYERFGRAAESAYAVPLGASVYDLQRLTVNDWLNAVYAQGAAFYGDVYNTLGPGAFWAAMREVYATQRFEIVTPWELLTTFARHSGAETDLGPLYELYFSYDWAGDAE